MSVVGERLAEALAEVTAVPIDRLLEERYNRFRGLGVVAAEKEKRRGLAAALRARGS